MRLDALRLVVQFALGLVFLLSALGKLRHPLVFLRGVAEFEILPVPLAYAFGALVIPAEAFLAAAHLTGWGLRAAVPLGLALLSVFTVAVAISLRRNRDLLCHCFDSLRGERISGRSLAQLGLLLAAELLLLSQPPGLVYPQRVATLGDVALAAVWATFSLLAGLWLLRADEVIQLFRRHRCKTCSQAPEPRPVS